MPSDQELLALLASGDARLAKRGLQIICDAIEAGKRVNLTRDSRIYGAIASLKGSEDILVRRWLYKLIALLDIKALAPWVEGQLHGHEQDPENITWAAGCLTALVGPLASRAKLIRADLDPLKPSFVLAGDYFRFGPPIDRATLKRTLDNDDPLAHKWLSMRFGKDQTAFPKEVLPDLVTSTNATVVEYAIWATHRNPSGELHHLPLYPQDLDQSPSNVRRWYMRLLLKDAANLAPYSDVITHAMNDSDQMVREGIAIGFSDVDINSVLSEEVANWFLREPEPLVRLALARAMSRVAGQFPYFKALLAEERESSGSLAAIVLPNPRYSKPAKIFVPEPRHRRKEVTLYNPVPVITSSVEDDAYLLGVDTVNFSTRPDRQQFTIFRDLLDALAHEDLVATVEPENFAVLLTGDGAFLGFRGARYRLAPLQVAVSLQRAYEDLRAYQLRFGVNSGPATWISFKQSGIQLISHAVNWTARVMSASGPGQILISDPYYRQYVVPARDQVPGLNFSEVAGLRTKHGEDISAWEVTHT